ncbi:hypothetical protein XELAEV_18002945mg [Xenopus laevis]|nr:hypothetical protein XELAEV_18002945mg [Xenopus laevis]
MRLLHHNSIAPFLWLLNQQLGSREGSGWIIPQWNQINDSWITLINLTKCSIGWFSLVTQQQRETAGLQVSLIFLHNSLIFPSRNKIPCPVNVTLSVMVCDGGAGKRHSPPDFGEETQIVLAIGTSQ